MSGRPSLDVVLARAAHLRVLRAQGHSFRSAGRIMGLTKGQVAGLTTRHIRNVPDPRDYTMRPPRKRPARAVKPKVVAKPAPPAPRKKVASGSVTQAEHEGWMCCWPVSAGRPWRFCSEPKRIGAPYCAKHLRAARARPRDMAA